MFDRGLACDGRAPFLLALRELGPARGRAEVCRKKCARSV